MVHPAPGCSKVCGNAAPAPAQTLLTAGGARPTPRAPPAQHRQRQAAASWRRRAQLVRRRRRLHAASDGGATADERGGGGGPAVSLAEAEGTTALAAASLAAAEVEEAAADAAALASLEATTEAAAAGGGSAAAASGGTDTAAGSQAAAGQLHELLGLAVPALGMVLADPLMSLIDVGERGGRGGWVPVWWWCQAGAGTMSGRPNVPAPWGSGHTSAACPSNCSDSTDAPHPRAACVGRVSSVQLAALGPNTAVFNFCFQARLGGRQPLTSPAPRPQQMHAALQILPERGGANMLHIPPGCPTFLQLFAFLGVGTTSLIASDSLRAPGLSPAARCAGSWASGSPCVPR